MASPSLRRTDADTRERLAEARRQAGRDAPWRRRFRDWRRRLAGGLAVRIAPRLIRLLARSWRLEVQGAEAFEAQLRAGPAILVLWHGRMLPASALFRDRGFAVLVSPSGDGELAVGVLKRLGCLAFRGSTSRGGSRALRVLADHLAAGRTVGMTPDGPRGPRHTFRVGAPWLARETGAPIITLAFATDSAWRLRSWDRFAVPKPRARVVVSIGVGVRVPREMDDAGLEEISAALRERLIADERAVFVALGVPHDHDA